MSIDLTNPIFHDNDKAREHLEAQRWPNGPFCPHCGEAENFARLHGKSHRPGLFHCNSCEQGFTVTVGSVIERSKIPLCKWVLAYAPDGRQQEGHVQSKQLQRMLGVTYKTAWFMTMRIREAMTHDPRRGPLGGDGKIIESDETFVGGKKKNVHNGKPEPKKHAVHALVERGGEVRAKHVADVTAKTLRDAIVTQASRKSELHTDESLTYYWLGREFDEAQDRQPLARTSISRTALACSRPKSFFALLKRGVYGTFHAVSELHLQRYVDEFAFRSTTAQRSGSKIRSAPTTRSRAASASG